MWALSIALLWCRSSSTPSQRRVWALTLSRLVAQGKLSPGVLCVCLSAAFVCGERPLVAACRAALPSSHWLSKGTATKAEPTRFGGCVAFVRVSVFSRYDSRCCLTIPYPLVCCATAWAQGKRWRCCYPVAPSVPCLLLAQTQRCTCGPPASCCRWDQWGPSPTPSSAPNPCTQVHSPPPRPPTPPLPPLGHLLPLLWARRPPRGCSPCASYRRTRS